MPKRTIGLVTLQARPGRSRKKDFVPLDDIDGMDLLYFFRAWAASLDPDSLTDRAKGRYLHVTDIAPRGRYVVLTAESGFFGERGKTFDVDTHTVAHERSESQSATVPTRLLFMVPPGGKTGVFVVERQGITGSGTRLISEFKRALNSRFSTYSFDEETVLEADAWAEGAELLAVKAVAYDFPVDVGDGIEANGRTVGRLEQSLEPERGQRFLPRKIWEALRARKISSASFLGFKNADIDDTFVTVMKDGRTKTFSLDHERVPAIRVVVAEDGVPAPTLTELSTQCLNEVRDYFEGMGLTWEEAWRTGKWTDEAMKVTIARPAG